MQMKTNKIDFDNSGIKNSIMSLAIPMMCAQFFALFYNIVDRIYIGNLPDNGESALGGIGICFPVITIINGFANLFGLGGTPLFSIAKGEKKNSEAEKIMSNSFWMLVFTGFILTVFILIFHKSILYLFGASQNTYSYASTYILVYSFGTVFQMISLGMNPFINCQGFAKVGMMTVVVGTIVNLVLDPIFIFALDLGVCGAAIATLISQAISAVWVMLFITGSKPEIRLNLRKVVLNVKCVIDILKLGTASFIMHCTDSLVLMVCNRMLFQTGGDLYISIMTIINSVRQIIQIPVTALTDGASTVISFNYGAKKYEKVRKAIIFVTLGALLYTLLILVPIMISPKLILSLFGRGQELILNGANAMKIYFIGFFMMAFQYSGQCVFKSLNMPKYAVFFSVFRKVIIVVPLTLLLPKIWGVNGVFYAEAISNFVGGSICYITMSFVVRKFSLTNTC